MTTPKPALLALAILLVASSSVVGDDSRGKRQVLRPHEGSSRKYDIIEDGERVGSVRIDKDGEAAKIRDPDGNVKGRLERDDDDRHRYRIYEEGASRSKSVGTVERQSDHHKRYDIEDPNGRKIGEIRPRHGAHEGEYVIEYK